MRELGMDDRRLGAALADLGTHVAFPPAPDVRARVLARIAEPRRAPWWGALASPRYGFAPVLATLALILVALLVVSPEARATAADILRLRGVEIFRGPVPSPTPTPPRTPGASASPALDLGELVTLDAARQRAGYPVLLPSDPALGTPDAVYLRSTSGSTQVSFVYAQRTGIPLSAAVGLSALVSEFGGTVDAQFFGKVLDPNTKLENVTVNGQPGFWIEGHPHFFFYTAGPGNVQQESLRLAGNTLLWQQNGLVLRLEAEVDRATALRIAASVQ